MVDGHSITNIEYDKNRTIRVSKASNFVDLEDISEIKAEMLNEIIKSQIDGETSIEFKGY